MPWLSSSLSAPSQIWYSAVAVAQLEEGAVNVVVRGPALDIFFFFSLFLTDACDGCAPPVTLEGDQLSLSMSSPPKKMIRKKGRKCQNNEGDVWPPRWLPSAAQVALALAWPYFPFLPLAPFFASQLLCQPGSSHGILGCQSDKSRGAVVLFSDQTLTSRARVRDRRRRNNLKVRLLGTGEPQLRPLEKKKKNRMKKSNNHVDAGRKGPK